MPPPITTTLARSMCEIISRMPLGASLDEVLELVPELAGRPRTVTELPGGLTNANHKVVVETGAYVVRRWSDDTGLLAIDRDNEH